MAINDTIIAVSSASVPVGQTARSIVRLSGSGVWDVLAGVVAADGTPRANTVLPCRVRLSERIVAEGMLYCFFSPHSYTGEDMAELHLWAAPDGVSLLLERLCGQRDQDSRNRWAKAHPTREGWHLQAELVGAGHDDERGAKVHPTRPGHCVVRLAEPGEFTLRAYLNGKMDLTQAEAVAQIVSSANSVQLAAAEKLLHGRFSQTIGRVRSELLEVLSLIEAGLDFTEEDIEFITAEQAATRITAQQDRLQGLLDGSVQLERLIDLDAVGLAGLPNAGKSSLLNALLGRSRSIVSPIEATTRDILTGVLDLDGVSCVLFDCAGLLPDVERRDAIDRLAHQAACDALQRAAVALFCIDASKPSVQLDTQIRSHIRAATVIPVATKADLTDQAAQDRIARRMQNDFDTPIIITSARTGQGLAQLKECIKNTLVTGRSGDAHADRLTLNRRHRHRLEEAVKTLTDAADDMNAGREDTAAMLLRQSYEILGGLERENVSEQILDSIFSRFCIGK